MAGDHKARDSLLSGLRMHIPATSSWLGHGHCYIGQNMLVRHKLESEQYPESQYCQITFGM